MFILEDENINRALKTGRGKRFAYLVDIAKKSIIEITWPNKPRRLLYREESSPDIEQRSRRSLNQIYWRRNVFV